MDEDRALRCVSTANLARRVEADQRQLELLKAKSLTTCEQIGTDRRSQTAALSTGKLEFPQSYSLSTSEAAGRNC